MAVRLRILSSLRNFNVGTPLTLKQFLVLTPEVMLDRLLARRLYPLALEVAKSLKMPKSKGENRILGHWACYRVASSHDESAVVARSIIGRLGNHPQIPYVEVASKAAEVGKKDLAIKLLEHEVCVFRGHFFLRI